jgi:proteic killer suppression protein
MRLRTFAHPGLERLYRRDQTRGLSPAVVDKLRKMLAFLQDMETVDELRTLPAWQAHRLKGSRRDTWALHVTRNWRLTFRVEDQDLVEVNYEDYH